MEPRLQGAEDTVGDRREVGWRCPGGSWVCESGFRHGAQARGNACTESPTDGREKRNRRTQHWVLWGDDELELARSTKRGSRDASRQRGPRRHSGRFVKGHRQVQEAEAWDLTPDL